MTSPAERIQEHLSALYGPDGASQWWPQVAQRLSDFGRRNPSLLAENELAGSQPCERDVLLITYADQVQQPGQVHISTLQETLSQWVGDCIRNVHLLPLFPSSSDDGFSVVDYMAVDPSLGTWDDVRALGRRFRLMLDAVVNHVSRQSAWFRGFLQDRPPYDRYFITLDPHTDLSSVVRPRTTPLLTPVKTVHGIEHVWTTFSDDQIDLDYSNPRVLLEMINVLLFYVEQGARWIRLDAIAYLWKEVGTPCIHLPQTHRVVKVMRAVLDAVAPGVRLITETNVPHAENISYFGGGVDEAQIVYQFPLPPLTLHAFCAGDATHLQAWASSLPPTSRHTTFLNFLASHDGIGLRPLETILSEGQVAALCDLVVARGGHVSYRTRPDGSSSPYELNIAYFDALNDPGADEAQRRQVDRFMAAQAILLSLAGVPGIYVHSLFGSQNWQKGVTQMGHYRAINRQKWQRHLLQAELADPASIRHQVFHRYRELVRARIAEPAFHPAGGQQVLVTSPALFTLLRTAPDGSQPLLCIHNVTGEVQEFAANLPGLGFRKGTEMVDLVGGGRFSPSADGWLRMSVPAYAVLWLREPR